VVLSFKRNSYVCAEILMKILTSWRSCVVLIFTFETRSTHNALLWEEKTTKMMKELLLLRVMMRFSFFLYI